MTTPTKPSSIVDDLHVRRIDANQWAVESRSELFAEHTVRRDSWGTLHCDNSCRAYGYNYRCSHVASVLRYERESKPRPRHSVTLEQIFAENGFGD